MALTRLTIDGYGQIEPNRVAFTRDGRIEAQCALADNFTAAAPCEVGMLLAVDKAAGEITLPAASETNPIGLNYSTEHLYDTRNTGRKNFKMTYEADGEYFYPRIGFLSVGDIFTTNCLCADLGTSADFADEEEAIDALKAFDTTAIYGTYSTLGAIKVTDTAPTTGLCLQVVGYDALADGQDAAKFIVVRV